MPTLYSSHEGLDQIKRTRVLVLGGGIHGVGILHDLASRGWKDIHLVEKSFVGAGTSSKSTKLIHGGLRYLQNIMDFGLVAEGLKERSLLMELAPDLVHPVELIFPILKRGGYPRSMIKIGLSLYDLLAGRHGLHRHRSLTVEQVAQMAPVLKTDEFKHFYSFFDGQTDDLLLVQRVAQSAVSLGGRVWEGCAVKKVSSCADGWLVTLLDSQGKTHTISALYVVNCLGPWAHEIMDHSPILPQYEGLHNQGSHILVRNLGLKAGLFFQSPKDGRIFFVLPWKGLTLIGTTETHFTGNPDEVYCSEQDVEYLLNRSDAYLSLKLQPADVLGKFSGLRWLAYKEGESLSRTSRSHVVSVHPGQRGMFLTLYGGKLTGYRHVAMEIGTMICKHFGEYSPSRTHQKDQWAQPESFQEESILQRFVENGDA